MLLLLHIGILPAHRTLPRECTVQRPPKLPQERSICSRSDENLWAPVLSEMWMEERLVVALARPYEQNVGARRTSRTQLSEPADDLWGSTLP